MDARRETRYKVPRIRELMAPDRDCATNVGCLLGSPSPPTISIKQDFQAEHGSDCWFKASMTRTTFSHRLVSFYYHYPSSLVIRESILVAAKAKHDDQSPVAIVKCFSLSPLAPSKRASSEDQNFFLKAT